MTTQPLAPAWDFDTWDFDDWEDPDDDLLADAVLVPDRDTLRALAPSERTDIVERYVRQELARVLGIAPAAIETTGCTMNGLGVGSVAGLQIQNRIEADLGVEVNLQMLLLANSADEFIDCLAGQLGPGDSVHATRSRRPE
ncbi:acyl carrier protein [Streptomyces xanthochromogenes]|uniref:acyl carrier protein n=1 Tax=Streptomyces xanthochromogenes TaxID=67384 RepID=UPI003444203D